MAETAPADSGTAMTAPSPASSGGALSHAVKPEFEIIPQEGNSFRVLFSLQAAPRPAAAAHARIQLVLDTSGSMEKIIGMVKATTKCGARRGRLMWLSAACLLWWDDGTCGRYLTECGIHIEVTCYNGP